MEDREGQEVSQIRYFQGKNIILAGWPNGDLQIISTINGRVVSGFIGHESAIESIQTAFNGRHMNVK